MSVDLRCSVYTVHTLCRYGAFERVKYKRTINFTAVGGGGFKLPPVSSSHALCDAGGWINRLARFVWGSWRDDERNKDTEDNCSGSVCTQAVKELLCKAGT